MNERTLTDTFGPEFPFWLKGEPEPPDRLQSERDRDYDEFCYALIKHTLSNPRGNPEYKVALYTTVRERERQAEAYPEVYTYTEALLDFERNHGLIIYTPKPQASRAKKKERTV